ncbi:MAG TPA: ATP-binding protein, partial [Chloroflexota bacterium]
VANAAAREMLSSRLEDLAAVSLAPSATAVPALVTRALEGAPLVGEEFLVDSEQGERVLSASATAVREETGEISGSVIVLRDVTAEREVDRIKDEFVATVSHELRTPITAVLGYTDLLLRGVRGPLLPPQRDALTSVRNAGQRLLALIEDLLDMSKLEAGKQELNLEEVVLPSAIERAASGVSLMAASRGIRLVQLIPSGLPPVIADDLQLQRILGNLLSNAVKFTPDGGTVSVSAAIVPAETSPPGTPPGVVVQVSDTGVGIAPEKQEKIWEKFQQADSSSRRAFGGTGLGLAIVKALVELHGGRVWVESEGVPGKGSVFGFSLQAAAQS